MNQLLRVESGSPTELKQRRVISKHGQKRNLMSKRANNSSVLKTFQIMAEKVNKQKKLPLSFRKKDPCLQSYELSKKCQDFIIKKHRGPAKLHIDSGPVKPTEAMLQMVAAAGIGSDKVISILNQNPHRISTNNSERKVPMTILDM